VGTEDQATLLEQAARLLKCAASACALTGAGISTPSGIPDFRSAGSGLWERADPMQVASLTAFRYHPEAFFAWIRPLAGSILASKPNAAHIALARLEAAGRLAGLVTQNIDGLHARAGSRCLFEIHGHLRTSTCVACYRSFETNSLMPEFARTGAVPRCEACGGVLKPDVVLFGEQLPHEAVRGAEALLGSTDLLLIAGSSLEVTPAALMPQRALQAGARLIIVNREPTYLDVRADVVFHQDVTDVLPALADEVLRERT
jgi:NAD-dependent deacetylase